MSARLQAPAVGAITNVTALVGRRLEPLRCHLYIGDATITGIVPVSPGDPLAPALSRPAVDPPAPAPPPGTAAPLTIDGTGMIAMPGMVDTHDHLRVLAPGLSIAEGLALDDFIRVQWATQAHMGAHDYRICALLGTLQRLKCGITTVIDHAYTFHAPGLDEACIAGYQASGIRWAYARGIMTRPYEPVCETFEHAADAIRAVLDTTAVTPQQLFVAPVSIRQATVEDFARAAALAAELGAGTYTHASETTAERAVWQAEAGAGPIEALDRAGFLSERTVLAHCVLLDDAEIALLAERGTHVAHCPSNNMKLAKGVTRVPELLAAGVNVCLGVDMMSDMHAEMRAELHMQSLHTGDPAVLSPRDVLQMATWRGAAAAAPPPAATHSEGPAAPGELAPGRAADITLMPARSLLQAPLVDPAHAVVHHTQAPMVRHVLVDGRLVVCDGASTLVDEAELLAEAEAACTAWLGRLGAAPVPAVEAGPAAPAGSGPGPVPAVRSAWFSAPLGEGS